MLASWLFFSTLSLQLPSAQKLFLLILLITMLFWLCALLGFSLSSSISLPPPFSLLYSLLAWPGPICWPRSVYYILSLSWTLPDALAHFLPHIYNKNLQVNHTLQLTCYQCLHHGCIDLCMGIYVCLKANR